MIDGTFPHSNTETITVIGEPVITGCEENDYLVFKNIFEVSELQKLRKVVLHFRISLVDEPGVELIPGTHRRWDSNQELDVRLEQSGRKNHEDLPAGV